MIYEEVIEQKRKEMIVSLQKTDSKLKADIEIVLKSHTFKKLFKHAMTRAMNESVSYAIDRVRFDNLQTAIHIFEDLNHPKEPPPTGPKIKIKKEGTKIKVKSKA